jgi:hypothetical protein
MEFFQQYQQGQEQQRLNQFEEAKMQQQERAMQQEQTLGNLAQRYMRSGDPRTIAQIAALSPQRAEGLMKVQQQVMQNQARGVKSFANTFHNTPESQKAETYPELIKRARASGVDTSGMPLEYNKDTAQQINETIRSESQKADQFLSRDVEFGEIPEGYYLEKETRRLRPLEGFRPGVGEKAFEQTQKLRKEYLDQSKEFIDVRDSYGRVKVATKEPSAAGDVALVFNFMKMLDPASVVREGEFAVAARAAGLPDRIVALAKKVDTGQILTPNQRKDFLKQAKGLYTAQESSYKRTRRQYSGLARQVGLPQEQVALDLSLIEEEQPTQQPQKAIPELSDEELDYWIEQQQRGGNV